MSDKHEEVPSEEFPSEDSPEETLPAPPVDPSTGRLNVRDTATGRVPLPAATPTAVFVGAIVALALLALAGIAIHDLTVRAGWVHHDELLRGSTHWGADVGWQDWMWPVAVGFVIVGVALLWTAIAPRRRHYVAVGEGGVLWTRPVSVARRCSAAVGTLPGVHHATTALQRRGAAVTVTGDPALINADEIDATVTEVLTEVGLPSRVKVKITGARNRTAA